MLVEHYTAEVAWTLRPVVLSSTPFQYKPTGALYTTPVGSSHSWRQWCEEEAVHVEQLRYRVELEIDTTGLVVINIASDLDKLPWVTWEKAPMLRHVDWFGMKQDGVTGVWLTAWGEMETRWGPLTRNLYGWDCETVAILDERIVRRYAVCPLEVTP